MSEDLPAHLVQALVQTGNMVSEREMNNTIRRIGHDNIFPKAPFAADSDFIDVNGKIYFKFLPWLSILFLLKDHL
jgi:hypothetical protein